MLTPAAALDALLLYVYSTNTIDLSAKVITVLKMLLLRMFLNMKVGFTHKVNLSRKCNCIVGNLSIKRTHQIFG